MGNELVGIAIDCEWAEPMARFYEGLLGFEIFGNVDPATVADIAQAIPAMVYPGGYVIWTRGGGHPVDRRFEVRHLFIEAGMPEVSFDGAPEPFGVGVDRVTGHLGTIPAGHLLTFHCYEATTTTRAAPSDRCAQGRRTGAPPSGSRARRCGTVGERVPDLARSLSAGPLPVDDGSFDEEG